MSVAQTVAHTSPVPTGLSSAEAARRASEFGPNAVAKDRAHPLVQVARHFWHRCHGFVKAEPQNEAAKDLLADIFEQIGYTQLTREPENLRDR